MGREPSTLEDQSLEHPRPPHPAEVKGFRTKDFSKTPGSQNLHVPPSKSQVLSHRACRSLERSPEMLQQARLKTLLILTMFAGHLDSSPVNRLLCTPPPKDALAHPNPRICRGTLSSHLPAPQYWIPYPIRSWGQQAPPLPASWPIT